MKLCLTLRCGLSGEFPLGLQEASSVTEDALLLKFSSHLEGAKSNDESLHARSLFFDFHAECLLPNWE